MMHRAIRRAAQALPPLEPSLLLAILLGLAVRLALWGRLPRLGMLGDEAEYLAAADWLSLGRGFAWHTQYLWTRAPLYPLYLAAHLALFGHDLAPIFIGQSLLGLLNIALVYLVASQAIVGGPGLRRAPGIAAILAALYLPFASYGQILLSETLFTSLLLGSLAAMGAWARRGGLAWLALAGALLGLATLTRGLALGFLPLAGGWVAFNAKCKMQNGNGWLRSAAMQFCILTFAFCIIVAPWTYYASRAYGGLVAVDTTGSFNLALGARTAYDGGRSDAPLRNFVLALLDPTLSAEQRRELLADPRGGSCLYAAGDAGIAAALATPAAQISQAERQRLLGAEAACLLRAAPAAFARKSLGELVDLFQINYTGDERLSGGFALGRLPAWYALALFLLDDTLYVLALPLAVIGWGLLRQGAGGRGPGAPRAAASPARPMGGSPYRFQGGGRARTGAGIVPLIGLWLLYNLATAPLLFAINRFRVPLMPLAFVLAACALAALPRWGGLRTRYGAACAGLAGALLLAAATPYAYLEPRAPGAASRWASYLGPYPSSMASTWLALTARPAYLAEQRLAGALGAGDAAAARQALADPDLPGYAAAVGAPLLDGLEGRPAAGLDRLASQAARPLEDWQRSLVAGELLRELGDQEAARRELNPPLVDSQNPVAWAWQWLHPPPLPGGRIDLADDNDLGYIRGFYLGRFDQDLGATLRWATGESALRFPRAASGGPQQLCLRVTGLGWPQDLALPTVTAALDGEDLGGFALTRELREVCLDLPARPAGSDLAVDLRSDTFVPDALDLVRQQGPQVGQLRRLAYQLDWAEIR